MNKTTFIIFVLSGCASFAFAQKENKYLRNGNDAFADKLYSDADVLYRKALDLNTNSFEGYFNLGNALYKQNQFSEAEVKFNRALELANDNGSKAMAYYNMGNAQLKQNKYKESIETYKNALRQNPGDPNTIYNLSYAMHKLDEQQKGEQNQDKKENSDKENKEENKDQKNENDKKEQGKGDKDEKKDADEKDGDQQKNEDEKGQNGKNNETKEGENKEQQSTENAVGISPDDARKLLEALRGEEKKVQAKIMEQKGKGKKLKAEKEW